MQKDIARGHESEIQGLLFDMIDLGTQLHIDMPVYRKVAQKFQQPRNILSILTPGSGRTTIFSSAISIIPGLP